MGREAANVESTSLELRDEAGALVHAQSRVLHPAIVLCESRFLADRLRSGDEPIRGLQRASPASSGSAFGPCDLDPAVLAPADPERFRTHSSGADRSGSQRSGSGRADFRARSSDRTAARRSDED